MCVYVHFLLGKLLFTFASTIVLFILEVIMIVIYYDTPHYFYSEFSLAVVS